MSWFRKKPDNEKESKEQKKNLLSVVPVAKPSKDDPNQYRVLFYAGQTPLILKIILPKKFPQERPTMQIFGGNVRHHLVNGSNQIVCPELIQWGSSSKLGTVTDVVLQALTINPPVVVPDSSTDGSLAANANPTPQQQPMPQYARAAVPTIALPRDSGAPNRQNHPPQYQQPHHQHQHHNHQQHQQQYKQGQDAQSLHAMPSPHHRPSLAQSHAHSSEDAHHTPMPAIPSSFPEIQSITDQDQLRRLLDDDVALDTLMHRLETVRSMKSLLADLRLGNLATALALVEEEEALYTSAAEAMAVQGCLRDVTQDYSAQRARAQVLADAGGEGTVVGRLRELAAKADDVSEDLASNFVRGGGSGWSLGGGSFGGNVDSGSGGSGTSGNGNQSLEEFVQDFIETRKIYHKRAAIGERLQSHV